MATEDRQRVTWRRRDVLSGVATTTLLGGCSATESPETESPTTAPRTDPPSSTEAPSDTDENLSDTETVTPISSDTETPVVTNQSAYPADQPLRIGSAEDSFQRWFDYDDPLIGDLDADLAAENGAIQPVWSREHWRRIVTRATESEGVDPFAYEFVDETDFQTETVVVVQHAVIGGEWLRLLSVDGVGDPHLQLHVEQAGYEVANSYFYQYVFSRVPTDGTEIERITASVDDDPRSTRYVYRDESNSRRVHTGARRHGSSVEQFSRL